jgi:hypothetical protein
MLFDPPVIAWTTLPPLPGVDPPKPEPEDTRYLNMRVDLDHPVETLLPLIEKELGSHSHAYRRGRRRLDRVDFYIQVFDLAESGETFKDIARKLKCRPPTVKSAFLAARRNVFGFVAGPSASSFLSPASTSTRHSQKCPICRKAEEFEEMCTQARRYALQDHKSHRELMVRIPPAGPVRACKLSPLRYFVLFIG